MNNEFKNYYNELGLPKDGKYEEGIFKGYYISQDGIEKAMNRIKNQYGWGSREVERAQEAYNVLSNPLKRAEYNARLEEYIKNSKIVELNGVDPNLVGNEEKTNEESKPKIPVEENKEVKKSLTEEPTKEEEPIKKEEPTKEEGQITEKPKVEPKEIKNLFDEETLQKDAVIKAANRKKIINNSLIIGGSTLFFGPIGTIAAIAILKKKGKFKLQKLASKGRIKEVKTLESKIIDAENSSLERKIDELLNSPLKDNQNRYKLELAKLRYEHQIELLRKRIEFKKEQKSQLGNKAYNRLYVFALEKEYAAAIKFLEIRKKKAEAKLEMLESYNPNKKRIDGLTKIQNSIVETQTELETEKMSDFRKNQKSAKLNRLNTKRLQKINKMALKKNGISRNQVLLAVLNSPKNWFSHKDEQTQESIDLNSFSNRVR